MSTDGSGTEELSEALLSLCKSPTLSLESLLEIIGRYGLKPNDTSEGIKNTFFIQACGNKAVDDGIVQCLLEYFPDAMDTVDEDGWTPLHAACNNENGTLCVIKRLIAASENENNPGQSPLLRSKTEGGNLPLHILCRDRDMNVNEKSAIEILILLLEKCPESTWQVNNNGLLPIHFACAFRSTQFCQTLVDFYPESVRIGYGQVKALPLHCACRYNTLPIVEYLCKLYPDAVHQKVKDGYTPIHYALLNESDRETESALEIIRFLLDCDPHVKLQKSDEVSLLLFSCCCVNDDNDVTDIEAAMQIIEAIYDVHPEAIEDYLLLSHIDEFVQQVRAFINGELVHARLANDLRQMTTADYKGQLPLHHALRNNVRLGSIRLLVKGYVNAIRHADSNGALPLHLACQYHDSLSVVQYLADLDPTTLQEVDNAGNNALHYACREARYDLIGMLLESYNRVSVSNGMRMESFPSKCCSRMTRFTIEKAWNTSIACFVF